MADLGIIIVRYFWETKFLGATFACNAQQAGKSVFELLQSKVLSALNNIDDRPLKSDYKVWIYAHYLAPSINFCLAVNAFSANQLNVLQRKINQKLKKWLNLTRSTTLAALFHGQIMNLPYLPHMEKQQKLNLVLSVARAGNETIIRALSDAIFLDRIE